MLHPFLKSLGVAHPILQAPMAGVSTPELAAAVSNAGALGAISVGAASLSDAAKLIDATRERTRAALNVNVFCHAPARHDAARERAHIERFTPQLTRYDATPPSALREIYQSFLTHDAMLELLIEKRPEVVSFHFGVPDAARVARLRKAGCVLIASVTSVTEARVAAAAGVHALVAQGYEAGGHRGVFDPNMRDDRLSTFALTRMLVRKQTLPVIAAGGIMDGAGIAAALALGAAAAQLGTAFIMCPESSADEGYRVALQSAAAHHTVMTRVISGRLARCLSNAFTDLGENVSASEIPDYPIAYDLGKALHAAAKARGEYGFGAQWAGQGAPLSRPLPAERLIIELVSELNAVRAH
ncbi:MAG TPA: nitronate monooxygenase [Polyangiales bacterium]|nr:nitronate monooxygenase [Polyangiales bacterium]